MNFVAHIQSTLGFALGSIPSQAPALPWSTVTAHGTTCICSWTSQAHSAPPPITTASSHTYALTDSGVGVHSYVMIAVDWANTMDVLGIAHNVPPEIEAPLSQMISIHRWDASGNKIHNAPVEIEMCLNSTSPLQFFRYPDGSSVGNDVTQEGGSVAAGSSAGCYNVALSRTSSVVAFTTRASNPSPSPTTTSSSSPSSTDSSPSPSTDNGAIWLAFIAFLVFPVVAVPYMVWKLSRKSDIAKDAISTFEYPVMTDALNITPLTNLLPHSVSGATTLSEWEHYA